MIHLIDEFNTFDHPPTLAVAIGLNQAIVLWQIRQWLTDEKSGRYLRDNAWWIRMPYVESADEFFPYWSAATLRRTTDQLEIMGLIRTANYGGHKWFTIYYEQFDAFIAHWQAARSPNAINRKPYEAYKQTWVATLPAKKTAPGYVYLIQSSTGHYKIGLTKNPQNRLHTFSVKLPFEVEFVCTIATEDMFGLESELHDRFSDKHVNGEWFALSLEDVDYIKGLSS